MKPLKLFNDTNIDKLLSFLSFLFQFILCKLIIYLIIWIREFAELLLEISFDLVLIEPTFKLNLFDSIFLAFIKLYINNLNFR